MWSCRWVPEIFSHLRILARRTAQASALSASVGLIVSARRSGSVHATSPAVSMTRSAPARNSTCVGDPKSIFSATISTAGEDADGDLQERARENARDDPAPAASQVPRECRSRVSGARR